MKILSPELVGLLAFVALPLLGLFVWFLKQVLKGEVRFWRTPLDFPMLFLLGAVALSAFLSEDTPSSLFGTQGVFANSVFGVVGFVALYFLLSQTRISWKIAMRALIVLGIVLAILQYPATLLFAILAVFLVGRGGAVFGFILDFLLLAGFLGLLVLSSSFAAWLVFFAGLLASIFVSLWNRVRSKEPFSLQKLWLPLVLALVSLGMLISFVPNDSPGFSLNASFDNFKHTAIGFGPGTLGALENHSAYILQTVGVLGGLAWLSVFFSFLLFAFFLRSPFLAAGFGVLVAQFFYPSSTLLLFVSSATLGIGASTFEKINYPLTLSLKKFFEVRVAMYALTLLVAGVLIFIIPWLFTWYRADMLYAKTLQTGDETFVLQAQTLLPRQTDYKLLAGNLLLQNVLRESADAEQKENAQALSLQVQQALALLQEASKLSPKRVEAWEALGNLYSEISFAPGALDFAIQSFEKAVLLEPENFLLYTKQSALLRKKEKLEEARTALDKALALQPNSQEANLENILLLEAEGRKAEALGVARELSLRFPGDTKVLFELGRIYFNNQDWKNAVERFEQILELQPNNSDARFSLALALEKQGDKKRAIQELERVLELNPGKEEVVAKLEQLRAK